LYDKAFALRGVEGRRISVEDQLVAAQPLRSLKILVADDHVLFRAGLGYLLQRLADQVEVAEAGSLEEALERLQNTAGIDLVLVDIMMPGMDGASGIRRIRERAPAIPVVAVSVKDRPEDVRAVLDAGAAGHIPKSSTPEVMLGALRLALSGGRYLPPTLLEARQLREASDGFVGDRVRPQRPIDRLTERQRDVLSLLAQGMTNREIGARLGLATGTVKIHMTRIFKALDVTNRTQAVIAAAALFKQRRAEAEM
jgi:DNA-binding NarL/FixJ family response regulator